MISDDQSDCHYGSAGECRSVRSGTPIPAPSTPNLDVLAGYGTVFPIAHNTSAWCLPSRNSMLTGRYQRSIEGNRRLSEDFVTLPSALRGLAGEPGAVPGPLDPGGSIGGYCTLMAGKFTPAGDRSGFDAEATVTERRMGRLDCTTGDDGTPVCGTGDEVYVDQRRLREMGELFEFIDQMFYPVPDRPGAFAVQPFFVWYAPRIPHRPLRAPEPIVQHLFGSDALGLGGLFELGAAFRNGACPSSVLAFEESKVGTQREFYSSVWWVDDNIRELRKYLARKSRPHCILRNGSTRFSARTPDRCGLGTWATEFRQPVEDNTILVYLSDNGWFLPDSKHTFSETGYRTRLFVYDPRTASPQPSWRPADVPPAPPRESHELAHATDLLPTFLGWASGTPGTQACPTSPDGTPCDGRDLRAYLRGAPPPARPLRRALCGHQTERPISATRQRYLLTRPGSVGRCVDARLAACTSTSRCRAGEICLGGRCTPNAAGLACDAATPCPAGSACLGGRCQVGPPCLDDVSCGGLLGASGRCAAREARWCRNAPTQTCNTASDCPACAGGEVACGRLCEAQQLKLYLEHNAGASLVDLFADPDEVQRSEGSEAYLAMSSPNGPYDADLRRLSCCLDAWWPEAIGSSTLCGPGDSCPADFTCNQ